MAISRREALQISAAIAATTVDTWYMIVVLPNGKLVASDAITMT